MSERLCLRREPRIESGWRSGSFTRGRSSRTRCSHQCVREFSMDGTKKKKNRSKVLIATVDWPTYVRKDLSRFELIRVVFFIRFYDNFQRPPFSIRSMDSDTDNSTSNYYSRAMKKKKCNLEPVFTLIGRSVDTIVNEDRTNHRVFSVSIVINAQETRGGPLRALGPRWNFLIERSKESLIRRRKRNRIDDRVTKRLRWQDSIGFFLYRNDLAWSRRDTCGSIA